MRLQGIHFALVSGAHGTAGAVDDVLGIKVLLTLELGELAKASLEDTFYRTGMVTIIDRAIEQVVQVAAGPEVTLEGFSLGARLLDRKQLHENVVPRHEGDAGEQRHDGLDDRTGLENQMEDGKILGDVH